MYKRQHRGKSIKIANTNNWVDGGVASPNPFYWSSDGYGVLRNTFADGTYDFADSDSNAAKLTHNENAVSYTHLGECIRECEW